MNIKRYQLDDHLKRVLKRLKDPIHLHDIPEAKEWLYLNGFRDPIVTHEAFDFSAYEKTNGSRVLGIPSTPVYAPFSGIVLRAYAAECAYDMLGELDYGADLEIMGELDGCIITATMAHVIPVVGIGRVLQGTLVGKTYESPNDDEGTLGHLHFELTATYRGVQYVIDPFEVFLQGRTIKRIFLPHEGPFTKEELNTVGLETKFSKRLNYGQRPNR
ncbi:hypothetical protein HYV88_05940 [Candidatus Woesearchaeota archaeon]|nr:hypothetical protein [Candidatus Woesearchaeota archaeon]